MDRTVIEHHLARLDALMRDGRALREHLADPSATPRVRTWQESCAVAVNELSGGSKSHWLARSFSEAFLIRSIAGEVVQDAPLADIVDRVVGVLETAARSLATLADQPSAATPVPRPRRFDFVHNAALRPVLEQAYGDARAAFDDGQHAVSLVTACGILDVILTDALEHAGKNSPEWSFRKRIEVAEQAGVIRGGCARLPPIARDYRELADRDAALADEVAISARDAQTAMQVLQVVMRDLDPGR